MSVVNVEVKSTLSPAEVLRVLTDFSERRSEAWPGVDKLVVHEVGDTFAEVTEGNATTWERERYEWDTESGTVTAETLYSNVWAVGSRWNYRITPAEGGSLVGVRLERHGKNTKGKLIGALLPLVGKRVIKKGLTSALKLA